MSVGDECVSIVLPSLLTYRNLSVFTVQDMLVFVPKRGGGSLASQGYIT